MRNFIIRLFVNALALSAASYLIGGITLAGGFGQVLLVALVFGLVNALLKPVMMLLSLPLLLLTLGLFTLVINAVLLLITARLTDALSVSGFGTAVLGSLVISIVSLVLNGLLSDDRKKG